MEINIYNSLISYYPNIKKPAQKVKPNVGKNDSQAKKIGKYSLSWCQELEKKKIDKINIAANP